MDLGPEWANATSLAALALAKLAMLFIGTYVRKFI